MISIFKREVQSFFSSPIGYLIISLFLVLCGLFLWVFKGEYNLFDYGFADLSKFFFLVPWTFLFLIPAITMKSFSEEKKQGTLELLFIKPLSIWQTILGKFFGAFFLIILMLIPTLVYAYSISQLGTTVGNIDMGVVTGSYFGILFLACSFISIGIYASTLSENQIVAFIIAVVLSFLLYYGFEGLASLISDGDSWEIVKNLGMKSHYNSASSGVLDTKSIVYFISLTLFFLYATVVQLKNMDR